MTLITGTKLGRYEIRSKLGVGGMGEVFLAHDAMLDRKVALKILPPELASNQNRMRRFTQEAKAAAIQYTRTNECFVHSLLCGHTLHRLRDSQRLS